MIETRDNRSIGNSDINVSKNQSQVPVFFNIRSFLENNGQMTAVLANQIRIGFQDQNHGSDFGNAVVIVNYT